MKKYLPAFANQHFSTLGLPLLALAGLAACQAPPVPAPLPRPSASASAAPSANPSATPSPTATPFTDPTSEPTPEPTDSPALQNVSLHPGCDGATIVCPSGSPCALPSCAPPPPPLAQDAPLFIEAAKYEGLAKRFGLFSVTRAEDELGGLSPQLPLAKGLKAPCNEGEGLYRNGGRLNACVVYLVETGADSYELIDSRAKAAARFAPIESREEAVSYASMLTGYEPRYAIEPLTSWRFFTGLIAPTRVQQEVDDFSRDLVGYGLNLFDYQFFGCGPHPHYSVSMWLNKGGELRPILNRVKLYEDPQMDGLCVD